MNLNDLLMKERIDPKGVLVFRHRPHEPELRKVLPWFAAQRPNVFNAYQQTQGARAERAMTRASHVASFIGHEAGKAVFIGLYSVGASRPLTPRQFWQVPAHREMKQFGMRGFTGRDGRSSILRFELALTPFYAEWKGKLIVDWPPPERAWFRRAHRNTITVAAVLQDSLLDGPMPKWDRMVVSWEELAVLPVRWRSALNEWRGIYYIFDTAIRKGYVGAAYGEHNLLGRWRNYAASGHGGNRLLRERDPRRFRFSILELVSPAMQPCEVIEREVCWKERLHTRAPDGLNEN
jgi:hypothetical protein